jgi:hypothetical protein
MLDSGVSELYLPAPEKHYYISNMIMMHGGQTLRLAPTTIVKLMPESNCLMLGDDGKVWKENIVVDGGIWDMNCQEQDPNPWWVPGKDGKTAYERLGTTKENRAKEVYSKMTSPLETYTGHCMTFCRVKNFTLRNVTFRNPVVYAIELAYLEYFTIENITFDYVDTRFKFYNNDGVHVEGNCRNGLIRNLKGNCYDDMVALTPDGGFYGIVENIVVDGIWADRCHSAVRLLSHGELLRNITIKNVFGGYFKTCINLSKYHGGPEERGKFQNIRIENVNAHSCDGPRNPLTDMTGGNRPIVWVQSYVDVENLSINGVYREETEGTEALLLVEPDCTIDRLILKDITQKNFTGHELEFFKIQGEIKNKFEENLYDL